jgi:acylglycerol lipase
MSWSEDTFTGAVGRIVWRSQVPEDRPLAIVVIVHGWADHSGRYDHVAARLIDQGYAVYALDHHGHGRSDGARAQINLELAVRDLDQLVSIALERHPDTEVFLLGHSMGGALALRYAMAHGDRVTGLILSSPLADVEGRQAVKKIGKLVAKLAPSMPVAKLDTKLISRDPEVVKAYLEDPLVFHRGVPAFTAAQFIVHVDSLPADVAAVKVPTLLMYGTADGLVAPAGSVMVSQRIGSSDLQTTPYEGLYHEILNEPERERVLADLCSWIAARVRVSAA